MMHSTTLPAGALPAVLSVPLLTSALRDQPAIRLLDVRTPAEFETAHIAGAYNVPLDVLHAHAAGLRGIGTTPIVLVCQSGQRARKAEETLRRAGLPSLHVLDGGVNGWTAAGQPVLRGVARMSLERQVRIAAGALAAAGGVLALALDPLFAIVPAFVGSGLVFAGVTDSCAMGMLLARLSFNQPASCDPGASVRALAAGRGAPTGATPTTATTVGCCTG